MMIKNRLRGKRQHDCTPWCACARAHTTPLLRHTSINLRTPTALAALALAEPVAGRALRDGNGELRAWPLLRKDSMRGA